MKKFIIALFVFLFMAVFTFAQVKQEPIIMTGSNSTMKHQGKDEFGNSIKKPETASINPNNIPKGAGIMLVDERLDSIAKITIPFPVDLTPDQEKQMADFDKAPEEIKKAFADLEKKKVEFILSVLKGRDKTGKPISIDLSKVKDYEHKNSQIVLRVLK